MIVRLAMLGFLMAACVACGTPDDADVILGLTGDSAAGETLYQTHCSACHGDDGRSGTAQKNIPDEDAHEIVHAILEGEGSEMPSFRETLSDQEIADVAAYVGTL